MRHVLNGEHFEATLHTTPTHSWAELWRRGDPQHRDLLKYVGIKRFWKDRHSDIQARRILLRKLGETSGPVFRKTLWEAARKDPGIFPVRVTATEASIRNANAFPSAEWTEFRQKYVQETFPFLNVSWNCSACGKRFTSAGSS